MRARPALLLMTIAALAACGGGDSGDAGGTETTTDEATTDEPAADNRMFGTANSLTLTATGANETSVEFDGSDISMAGGCDGSTPISLGFRVGMPNEAGYFSFAFDTGEVVPTGATGTFPVEEIRWDDGIRTRTLPGGNTVDGPNRRTGAGSLTLDTHTATRAERRMVGSVTGEVHSDETDGPAEITAEFDVNLSCGVG